MGTRQCSNYLGISLLSFLSKIYTRCLEKSHKDFIKPNLVDEQCGFHPGHSTTDKIFALWKVFKKSWEIAMKCVLTL